jgi:uncharacterized membrane protein
MPENVKMPILPAHVEDTVQAIARLHAEHYARATPFQKTIEGLTARAGRPEFIGILTVLMLGWMAVNVLFLSLGYRPLDEPPFPWMQGAIGLSALYMTTLILITQRREDELASHREQLTLELGILSEQKSAKIIELLEELRRDAPDIRNRVDPEATAMSTPADPQEVLNAIKETHEETKANAQGTRL